ncbi:MAG TPA: S9 family peptidase [Thermoanaerobaculia bacterium]|nr:S9 family peptidase [Thermoanaerobaculia bacterium]
MKRTIDDRWMVVLMAMTIGGSGLVGCEGRDAGGGAEASVAEVAAPPAAAQRPHEIETHGDVRVDEYHWLRERDDPQVIAYLEAENAYTDRMSAHLAGLRETLFEEIVGRIAEDDETVPYPYDGYWYSSRFVEGKGYPIYLRRKGSRDVPQQVMLDVPEQVMLDVNELAENQPYTAVNGLAVSPNASLLAYGVDHVGRRKYTLRFKDLDGGEHLADEIPEVTGNVVWAADSRTVFYTKQHPQTLRSYQVYRHRLGNEPAGDELVYQEDDETFSIYLRRSKSREFLFIVARHTLRNEVRYLDAAEPDGEFRIFQPREDRLEYSVDHVGDEFYVRTNLLGQNYHLMSAPEDATGREHWREVVPHRNEVLLEGFELFDGYVVLSERTNANLQLRVKPRSGGPEHTVSFDEDAYVVRPTDNAEVHTSTLRFVYSSLKTPPSTFDYDLATRERELLKVEPVLGGYRPEGYVTERLWTTARDGERVPVSLVYAQGFPKDGSRPLLLYGYGSYGSSRDPSFSSPRISLLDRGFAFAIAHVRGGEEMGRRWYEQGKLEHKMNTFTDFIDVAEHLITHGYTSSDRLYAQGGSAGGLLVGAVINLRPDLFDGVVANVPFVDVVTTMLDDSIPLTTFEYDEWGDPRDPGQYSTMLAYSPYDNVSAQEYPNLLVTTGLHDSQVQYWEPAKWVARLRRIKTGDDLLLLRTNLEAGHGGASGRYRRFRETAFEFAFLLDLARRAGALPPDAGSASASG